MYPQTAPVVVLTGVDPDAMAATMVALQWDLPRAVAVRHEIDIDRHVLHRVVSDATGVLERAEIDLKHTCPSCALREDVLSALMRVARDGRWSSVLAHLPVGAAASQICDAIAQDTRPARHLRICAVITALTGRGLAEDLLGNDLLRERGCETSDNDCRGVGEVTAAMVEYADLMVLVGGADPVSADLVRALARPDARLLEGADQLNAQVILKRIA